MCIRDRFSISQRYQATADERYTTRLAEYEDRLRKAQEEGVVSPPKPKEPKKTKKRASAKKTKSAKKKAVTSAKKRKTAKKVAAKKGATKKAKTAVEKSGARTPAAASKTAKLAKLDDDDGEWISSDDED